MRIIPKRSGTGGGGGLSSGDVTTLIGANSGQPITGPVVTSPDDARGKVGDYSDDLTTNRRWFKVQDAPATGSWRFALLNANT